MSRKLTVYFTSDTHGYFYNTDFATTAACSMGMGGMAFPKDGNTLVIDGGDTIQGSPLTFYCHQQHRPQPISQAMNQLGYDYVTLGNHDFNYGEAWLKDHLTTLHAKCLCANVDAPNLPVFPSAVHVLENGLRVGLIGLVTDWVNRWEKPENLQSITVSDPFEAAERAVAGLKADIIIAIYHGGIEKDLTTGRSLSSTDENIACRLAEALPIDLLLTGHQHVPLIGGSWHGTHIVQTGCNAHEAVCVTMDEDGHFDSCFVYPTAEHALTQEQQQLRKELEAWLDRPIGRLSQALLPEEKLSMAMHGSPIADFFNRVQLWASHADISCTALGNEIRGFQADVTVRDVVASYVYANTLVVLEVTGQILHDALEQCARYFDVTPDGIAISEPFLRPKAAHYNYDYFAGLDYAFDLSKPTGQRVVKMERGGQPIRPDDRLSLCMCNYRATGAGDFDMYIGCPVKQEILIDISELILDYLNTFSPIEIAKDEHFQVLA